MKMNHLLLIQAAKRSITRDGNYSKELSTIGDCIHGFGWSRTADYFSVFECSELLIESNRYGFFDEPEILTLWLTELRT